MMIFVKQERFVVNSSGNGGKLIKVQGQEYRNQRKVVRNLTNQAKITHYSSQVQQSSGDQRKLLKITGKFQVAQTENPCPSVHLQ